jgi:hypothetical protein
MNQPSAGTSSAADLIAQKLQSASPQANPVPNPNSQTAAADLLLSRLSPPAPAEPTPADPAPADQAQDPAPGDPPAPAEPTPADPAPADQAQDPAPGDPPAPAEPDIDPEFARMLSGDVDQADPNDPASASQNQIDNPKEKELSEKVQNLEQELSKTKSLLENPLVSALAEFVAAGNDDITSFVKEISQYDPGQMSIEEMYRQMAIDQGFEGDSIDEAVKEQMDEFASLTMLKRKEEESRLRNMFGQKANQKLTALTERMANSRVEQEQHVASVSAQAEKDLSSQVEALVGKSWKTIKIESDMADQIKKVVPAYASMIAKYNENGQLESFDIQKGIRMAMFDLYEDTILSNAYKYGKTKGYQEAMVERVRPTATPAANTPAVPSSKTKEQEIRDAAKDAAQSSGGKKTLFSIGGGKNN